MNLSVRKALTGILFGAALLPASGTLSAAAPQAQAPSVRVEEVTMIDRSEPKTYVGTVAAADTVNIVARVSGTMEKAPFKEGSMVRKGDLLFEIEDTIYAANVRSAKSVLAQMEAEYAFAQKEYERYQKLIETQATAQTTYDSSLRTLKSYEAKIEEAKADLIRAENDLSYTKIYSPLDGRIGSNIYSEGNYITPETGTLATIVRYDPVKIKFSMSEADFFRHFGNGNQSKSELQISRADGQPFKHEARLDFIDNRVDSNTGTLMLQFEAPNPEMELIPGGYVTVKFTEKFEKPLPSVNVAALMTDGKDHFVYVVGKDNKVEKRKIVTGSQIYDRPFRPRGRRAGHHGRASQGRAGTDGQPGRPGRTRQVKGALHVFSTFHQTPEVRDRHFAVLRAGRIGLHVPAADCGVSRSVAADHRGHGHLSRRERAGHRRHGRGAAGSRSQRHRGSGLLLVDLG